MQSSWRDIARPIISKVIADVGMEDMKAVRAALRESYPFGERKMWPYKVWCDEVRLQLGLKKKREKRKDEDCKGQEKFFLDKL